MGANANTYTTANPVTRRFELEAGHEYQITPTKYETGDEARFLLRVFSQQPLQIKLVNIISVTKTYVCIYVMSGIYQQAFCNYEKVS